MSTFEDQIRLLAASRPSMSLGTAVRIAQARVDRNEVPLDIRDPHALAGFIEGIPEVVSYIAQGKVIHAIKETRAATGAHLREAKTAVEILVAAGLRP